MDGSTKQTATTTQTQVRNLAAPTPQELRAQALYDAQTQAYAKELESFLSGPLYHTAQQASQGALNFLNTRAGGTAPLVSPYEQQLLDQAFNAPQRQAEEALRTALMQDAQRRGMTLLDSPVGNEYLRQQAALQSQFGSNRAQAALNLSQQNFQNMAGLAPLGLNLQQQAQQNRLALSDQARQFADAQQRFRLEAAPVTSTGTTVTRGRQPGSQSFAQIAGGLGSLAGGLFGRQGAYQPLTQLGSAAVDLFGNIRSGYNNRQMQNAPAPYGNVQNVPNYGINQDFVPDRNRWGF